MSVRMLFFVKLKSEGEVRFCCEIWGSPKWMAVIGRAESETQ